MASDVQNHHHHRPQIHGWQRLLNIKVRYNTPKMSRRNGSIPKLDLKLNLSPTRVNPRVESPGRSATVSPTSPPSSCLSSEMSQDDTLKYSSSPEATSMVLVGCPRCLMYVMLSENDPKCPKCKSTVLLDFLHDNTAAAAAALKRRRS
ncbi:hypothetical protein OIU74_028622 [Salix koriyanagi]|uniref:GIR1-like zinc ribbon domain-containing protein n=1 Tax=Salix koriyanagi TaxID=2511006 RepID=A0A9Q0ZTJ3_9ROSI|nr:hypothetical protein OIU74_028622 [Salix koriyanagi]